MTVPAFPAPLTPEGCDLAGNDWFPLYFDRLRRSRWWRRASDLCRARNVMLWGEAYKAVPAGSLDNNDDDLAEAAGFGFDIDAFLAVKSEIMAPWVLCSDGRWYHPTLCEVVLETWERISEKRRVERTKKAKHRATTRSTKEPVPTEAAGVHLQNDDVHRDNEPVHRDNDDVPGDAHQKEGGLAAQTGQDTTRQDIKTADGGAEARSATDWPTGDLIKILVATVQSPHLDPQKSPGLVMTGGSLERWRRAGASWEFDVVPIVTTLSHKARQPIASWKFFDRAIAQSITDNQQGLVLPEASTRRPTPYRGQAAFSAIDYASQLLSDEENFD